MPGYYMVNEKYDRTASWWDDFFEWRGLPQLVEVVSVENVQALDDRELSPEDWRHVASPEEVGCGGLFCFRQLGPLLDCISRLGSDKPINLLWVCREPIEQPLPPASPPTFEFLGYDLIDDYTRISALTNYGGGGFPAAFSDADISEVGLIRTFERAKRIQADLRREYPNEDHANCSLWAIFRSLEGWRHASLGRSDGEGDRPQYQDRENQAARFFTLAWPSRTVPTQMMPDQHHVRRSIGQLLCSGTRREFGPDACESVPEVNRTLGALTACQCSGEDVPEKPAH